MAKEIENLTLSLLRDLRRDQADQRTLLLALVDQLRRFEARVDGRCLAIEQRIIGLRDDLELMIRSEIMGRLTHFETVMDERIERRLDERREPTT